MNSEANSETALRYSCAIMPIGWNRLSSKPGWPACFQLIRLGHREASSTEHLTDKPNKAAPFRLIQPKGVTFV